MYTSHLSFIGSPLRQNVNTRIAHQFRLGQETFLSSNSTQSKITWQKVRPLPSESHQQSPPGVLPTDGRLPGSRLGLSTAIASHMASTAAFPTSAVVPITGDITGCFQTTSTTPTGYGNINLGPFPFSNHVKLLLNQSHSID